MPDGYAYAGVATGTGGANLTPEVHWVCPNCNMTDVTNDPRPHSRFHPCSGLKGLSAPYVQEGIDCKVEAHEREDYIAGEQVQTDGEGRPIMKIVTTRDDGTDCAVLAPTATGRGEM